MQTLAIAPAIRRPLPCTPEACPQPLAYCCTCGWEVQSRALATEPARTCPPTKTWLDPRSPPEPAEFRSGAREFLSRSLTQFVRFGTLKSPQPPRNPPEPAAEPAKKCNGASARHDFGPKEKTRNPPEPAPEPAVFRRCPTRFARFMVSHRDFIILLLKSGVKAYFAAWGPAEGLAWCLPGGPLEF